MWYVSALCYAWDELKLAFMCSGMLCLSMCFCYMCVTVASTVILAQASSSRPNENSWDLPRFCSSTSLKWRALVLSDASSRSGESDSPKRVLEEAWCSLLASSSRRGTLIFGRVVVSLRRAGFAQARACRGSLLQDSLRRRRLA